ncbi:hypothetical protein STEG23_036425, partial [Scotinomys teguina]
AYFLKHRSAVQEFIAHTYIPRFFQRFLESYLCNVSPWKPLMLFCGLEWAEVIRPWLDKKDEYFYLPVCCGNNPCGKILAPEKETTYSVICITKVGMQGKKIKFVWSYVEVFDKFGVEFCAGIPDFLCVFGQEFYRFNIFFHQGECGGSVLHGRKFWDPDSCVGLGFALNTATHLPKQHQVCNVVSKLLVLKLMHRQAQCAPKTCPFPLRVANHVHSFSFYSFSPPASLAHPSSHRAIV